MPHRIIPDSRVSSLSPGRIALGYAVLAILWIAFSDAVVTHLGLDPAVMTIKGTVFVFVTASLLYFTIKRLVQTLRFTSHERDETAKLYRTVVEASNEGICLLDASGRISFLNERLVAMLGRPAEELQGKRLQDFIEEPQVLAHRGAPVPETNECQLRTDSERKAWVLISRHPILNVAGEVLQVVATVIDITERKGAEAERRESAERFRAIADYTYDWESWFGIDGRLLWVNPAVERITGYTVDECMAMSGFPVPIVAEADRETVARQIGEAVEGSSRNDFEFRVRRKDGHLVWVAASWQPIYDSRGARLGHRSSIRDIGERKQAEEGLRRSEAYLAEAQRLAHTGSWVRDETGEIVHLSEELYRIFGLDPQEGLPSRETLRRRVHPEDVDRAVESVEKALREKTDTSVEYRIILPNGPVKHLQVIRHPVLNDRGDIVELVGTVIDITDRKRDEEALRQSEAYLAEAQRLSHTGSWAFDVASDKYVYASEECLRIFEFDAQGLPTREAISRLIHPGDWPRVNEAFEKTIHDKVDASSEFRITLPSGTVKHVHVIRHPVLNDAGVVVQLVGTVIDITDRKRSEEKVRQQERELREILDVTPQLVAVFRPDRKRLYANRPTLDYFGVTLEEWLSISDLFWFFHPDDRERVANDVYTGAGSDAPHEFEARMRRNDGVYRWFLFRDNPLRDEQGRITRWYISATDIEDRKRDEEALRRSEACLAESQRLTHTGSWAWDVASNIFSYSSEENSRIYGVDKHKDLETEAVLQIVHPEDRERVRNSRERSLREKVDTFDEFRIVLPDGTIKHIQTIRHPVLNDAGEVVELVGTSVDITDRKRAEETLRESETRFRTFVDHAADAFFMLDEQGTIIDVNQAACESLGYTRQELVGMNPMAFHLDSDRAQMESVAERAAAGETVVDTHRHRRKDGSMFPVEVHTNLVSYGGRRFLLKVARDISDRVQAEEQQERLRQLEAELAHINRVSMMGELTASIAHEVNQPLAGVVSNAGASLRWLAGDPPNLERAREAAHRIVRDGKRAGEIIARVRALTRRAATPQEKLDLNQTIQEVLALVGDEVKRNSVSIQTRFADDVFPVLGDRVQLQQVALNLVINAIEAMSSVSDRARELVITTRNLEPDQVQVTVEDSGTGLDPNTSDKIFDAFYTTKSGGTGMGLSISRSIIQAHGGRLWAEAKGGPGTMFHFTLPRYDEKESHT